jgi:probable addiction module antidote protein
MAPTSATSERRETASGSGTSGTMAKVETHAYDAAEYIETAEDAVLHLEAALENGDPRVVAETIGAIARFKGMNQVAEATGLSSESLSKNVKVLST